MEQLLWKARKVFSSNPVLVSVSSEKHEDAKVQLLLSSDVFHYIYIYIVALSCFTRSRLSLNMRARSIALRTLASIGGREVRHYGCGILVTSMHNTATWKWWWWMLKTYRNTICSKMIQLIKNLWVCAHAISSWGKKGLLMFEPKCVMKVEPGLLGKEASLPAERLNSNLFLGVAIPTKITKWKKSELLPGSTQQTSLIFCATWITIPESTRWGWYFAPDALYMSPDPVGKCTTVWGTYFKIFKLYYRVKPPLSQSVEGSCPTSNATGLKNNLVIESPFEGGSLPIHHAHHASGCVTSQVYK